MQGKAEGIADSFANLPFITEISGKIANVSNELCELTNYTPDELLGESLEYVCSQLLRMNLSLTRLDHVTDAYLFTKALEPREVTISILFGNSKRMYIIEEKPDSRLDTKLAFVEQLFNDNIVGCSIYSVPGLILLKANLKYTEFMDPPYNSLGKCLGKSLWESVPGFEGSNSEELFQSVIKFGKPEYCNEFRYDHYERGITYWDGSVVPIFIDGKLKYVYQTATDVTERVINKKCIEEQSEIIAYQNSKLEQQNTVHRTIKQIYESVINSKNLEELGIACLKIIEAITGSKFSFVGEIGADGHLHDITISDMGWEYCRMYNKSGKRISHGIAKLRGLYGSVLDSGKSLLTNEPGLHPESAGVPQGHPILTAFLGVPIKFGGSVVGMIAVGNREGGYRKEDQDILEALAPTIHQVLLYKRAQEELEDFLLWDIGNRKKAERELYDAKSYAESKAAQLDTVLENMTEGVVIADANAKLLGINASGLRMFGLDSASELKHAGDFVGILDIFTLDGNIVPLKEWPLAKALGGEKCTDYELRVRHKATNQEWIGSCSSTPVFDQNGKVILAIVTFRDITGQKMQQELLLNTEKEKNEVLKRVIDMKDEFLSLISHEFKTPLTVINSAIQAMGLICRNELSDKAKDFLKKIQQNSNRQLKLVNNLLDITRMNAGHFKINNKNVDIVYLTKFITESIRVFAEQKSIKLYFSSTLKQRIIGIDDEKYERILLNLLSNAVKYTPFGKSIYVRVSLKYIGGKSRVCVQVKDKGVGIPEDKREIIFQRFGQVDSSLTRQAEGTGIGLYLVNMLVKLLEGEIILQSKVGYGSTFTILLPACRVKETSSEGGLQEISDDRLIKATAVEFSDIYLP